MSNNTVLNPDIDPSDRERLYHTKNYGDFWIIGEPYWENNDTWYPIKFKYSGFERKATRHSVRYGAIKDPYYPIIAGVGFIGEIDVPPDIYHYDYARWANMLKRCYDPNHKSYPNYGALGVRVCDRWHNFTLYYYDMPLISNYDLHMKYPNRYNLDKDYLQRDIPMCNRVYSPETCIWLDHRENSMERDLVTNPNKVNRFHGVYGHDGRYYPEVQVNGKRYRLGCFFNEIAAANAYNNFVTMHLGQTSHLNGVPYMPPEEVIKYNYGAKEMGRIVDK